MSQWHATVAKPHPRTLRTWLAIDDRAGVVAYAQTSVGRLALIILFALIYAIYNSSVLTVIVTAGASAFAYRPRYRALAGFAASFSVFLLYSLLTPTTLTAIQRIALQHHVSVQTGRTALEAAIAVFFLGAALTLQLSRCRKNLLIARRPVLTLLATVVLLYGLSTSSLLSRDAQVGLWALLIVMTGGLWFLVYALIDQRTSRPSHVLLQLGLLHPFWGSSAVPFGKGATYLRKMQSQTPHDLAVTQLKGIKLLIWSLLLRCMLDGLSWLYSKKMQLPVIADLQTLHFHGQPYSITEAWLALVFATIKSALSLAVYGHQFIAVARLSGLRLPRNTWRPLEARSIAEYWNRYYFYFKELLADLFFYPTFMRVFPQHPRLRICFSTFMAAGVGNAIFHFIKSIDEVARVGLLNSIKSFDSYLFYCLVLSMGIGISQVRNRGKKYASGARSFMWSFVCIWGFVLCLHIFGDETRVYSLGERLSFMASLLGFY